MDTPRQEGSQQNEQSAIPISYSSVEVTRAPWWDEEDDANELLYGRTEHNIQEARAPLNISEVNLVARLDPELHLHAADRDVAYDSKD